MARFLGVDGVVIGALLPDSSVDFSTLDKLVAIAKDPSPMNQSSCYHHFKRSNKVLEKKKNLSKNTINTFNKSSKSYSCYVEMNKRKKKKMQNKA